MEHKVKKRIGMLWCILLLLGMTAGLLSGCGAEDAGKNPPFYLYYLNKSCTKVEPVSYTIQSQGTTTQVLQELLGVLKKMPESPEYVAPLNGQYHLQSFFLSNGQLKLDFSEEYKKQNDIEEVLRRAAVVRTLTQLDEVQNISFTVGGKALDDAQGIPVGPMSADSFIDNAGTEINAYEMMEVKLYFANGEGTRLVPVMRSVVFNSNISLEKVVVEELVKGTMPAKTETTAGKPATFPVLNPETQVLGVTVQDGMCYVNLSKEFLTQTYSVTPEVVIYSIANSLAELSNINKVQISVDGETELMFRDTMPLKNAYERNLDIVE